MDVKVEKMTISDLKNIKDILQTEFDDFWNYKILEEELNSSNSYYLVAKAENELENEIVGFAGIKVVLDEADVMNIVVKKSKRNNKIGSLLLEHLISLAKNLNCKSLSLEVNEDNLPAINLYKKFGFEQIGIRKNYYEDKNGIVMVKYLT